MNCSIKQKRICAFLAAFLVTAVLLLSGFFIVTHTEHDCTGEECPVCAELHACDNPLDNRSGRHRSGRYLYIYDYSETLIILPVRTLFVPGFFGQLENPFR